MTLFYFIFEPLDFLFVQDNNIIICFYVSAYTHFIKKILYKKILYTTKNLMNCSMKQ